MVIKVSKLMKKKKVIFVHHIKPYKSIRERIDELKLTKKIQWKEMIFKRIVTIIFKQTKIRALLCQLGLGAA